MIFSLVSVEENNTLVIMIYVIMMRVFFMRCEGLFLEFVHLRITLTRLHFTKIRCGMQDSGQIKQSENS